MNPTSISVKRNHYFHQYSLRLVRVPGLNTTSISVEEALLSSIQPMLSKNFWSESSFYFSQGSITFINTAYA